MSALRHLRAPAALLLLAALAGCGAPQGGLFGRGSAVGAEAPSAAATRVQREEQDTSTSIWRLFNRGDDPNTTVEVNKYLWVAAQDVLDFLPVESVDPFTGVIVTGFGTPPGGGRAYRATIYVQDPALDARSLRVALVARGGGPVAPDVQKAVEDAILTRARQLRIQDSRL